NGNPSWRCGNPDSTEPDDTSQAFSYTWGSDASPACPRASTIDSAPVLDWTNCGLPDPVRSPNPPWPEIVSVAVSPVGRYGGFGAHAALEQPRLSVLYTDP